MIEHEFLNDEIQRLFRERDEDFIHGLDSIGATKNILLEHLMRKRDWLAEQAKCGKG